MRLEGTCRASFGETLGTEEEVGDLAEVWDLAKGSWQLVDQKPDERIVKELKGIAKVLAKLVAKPTREELRRSREASKALLDEYFASPEGQAERARQAALSGPAGQVDTAASEDPGFAVSGVDGDPADRAGRTSREAARGRERGPGRAGS